DGRDAPGLESRNDTVTSHPSWLNLTGSLQIKHSSVLGNGGIFSMRARIGAVACASVLSPEPSLLRLDEASATQSALEGPAGPKYWRTPPRAWCGAHGGSEGGPGLTVARAP